MEHVIQYTETVPAIGVGKGCFVTRLVPTVVGHVQDVTMEMDHAIKPQENASVSQVTKEAHVWKLAVQVTMVISANRSVIAQMEGLVIT